MPEETVGYVHLEWTCKACGTRNKGIQKTCVSCGAQMSEQDRFELPAEQQLITDEAEKKRAELGPDFICPYCNTRNPADATRCSQCSGDLVGAKARAKGQVLGAYSDAKQPDVACPFCSAMNPASATKCKNCGGNLKKSQVAPVRVTPTSTRKSSPIVPIILGVFAFLLLAICGSCFALTQMTSDKSAVVQSVSWERSIAVLELKPVTKENWRDEIPSGSPVGTCTQKVRRTQDQPAPGAEKICGTPYVVDSGSGIGKVVQQCQYRISDDWCKYTKDEWTVVNKLVSKGTNLNPSWPNSTLIAGQREGDRSETYQVIFNADGKQYTYDAPSANDFAKFTAASQWNLKVNALGGVTSVQPR